MLSNKRQKTIKSYFHQTSFSKSKNGLYPSMPTNDLKLLQDAREAAPALFAKPGDKFEWTGWTGQPSVVEYVGRNTVPSKAVEFRGETTGEYKSPKKGWLIFKNAGGEAEWKPLSVSSGGIRDACGSWPLACHYLYNEDGEVVDEGTMVLPPEKVGVLNKYLYYGDDEEEEEGKSEKGPEKEIDVSNKLLQEAKKAVPVLFANPGDTFEWTSCHPSGFAEPCEMKYLGRNALRPTSERSPQIGWLVFKHLPEGFNNIDSIRSEISAYPYLTYSHYCYKDLKEATTLFELALWKAKIDEVDDPIDREACRIEVPGPVKDTLFSYLEGERKVGTLCIPPEKCGPIKGFVPGDDYW